MSVDKPFNDHCQEKRVRCHWRTRRFWWEAPFAISLHLHEGRVREALRHPLFRSTNTARADRSPWMWRMERDGSVVLSALGILQILIGLELRVHHE